jgi:hypothetical protein
MGLDYVFVRCLIFSWPILVKMKAFLSGTYLQLCLIIFPSSANNKHNDDSINRLEYVIGQLCSVAAFFFYSSNAWTIHLGTVSLLHHGTLNLTKRAGQEGGSDNQHKASYGSQMSSTKTCTAILCN